MQKRKRPVKTKGNCHRIETGCGHLYVTVGRDEGQIIEIFATLGKAGGCARCQNEALTRSISLGLRYGVPVTEYIRQLENIRCPEPIWEEGEQNLSCADAIAKVLSREIKKETEKK